MSLTLFIDMFYAAPEFWWLLALLFCALLGFSLFLWLRILKLRQKNYFLNRDRERYAETLYASKDGYFAFIYPDARIKDPRTFIFERCSRRLAVILNLTDGVKSAFEDVLASFVKDDSKNLNKSLEALKGSGLSFEAEFSLKNGKKIVVSGSRVNGIDGNIYCDILWFRDVSFANLKISFFENSLQQLNAKIILLETFFNSLPFPAWLRDENLRIKFSNRAYREIWPEGEDILGESGEKNLPLQVVSANKQKKQTLSIVKKGSQKFVEIIETPVWEELDLEKVGTCGVAIDTTDVNEIKRQLKQSQSSQLEIFGTLGTAFAVFDANKKLNFYNASFAKLFKLESVWLESLPSYQNFLDVVREKRLIPEVSNYNAFKADEILAFNKIFESKEDLMHLPDGRSFKRVRAPYSQGGLVFAFEDISANIAQQTAYTSLVNIQKDILNNLFDAILIFSPNGKLAFYNESYQKLWSVDVARLDTEPSIIDVLDMQQDFFSNIDNWDMFKKELLGHIFNPTTKGFSFKRLGGETIEVLSQTLLDGSTMITYRAAV